MTIDNQYPNNKDRIVIALGDPAGIGIEVTLKALGSNAIPSNIIPILVGCKTTIGIIYQNLLKKGINELANPNALEIIDMPFIKKLNPGKGNKETGQASFEWLTYATNIVLQNKARALVTAPISKKCWHEAGHFYPGQTERLAEISNMNNPSMLFTAISPHTGWRFNTLLATTHIPLQEVCKQLTPELVENKLNTLLNFCQKFTKHPRITIAGLNPHAGEGGKIGSEETKWLEPLIQRWQLLHPEVKLDGPISPDTCWLTAAKAWQTQPSQESPHGILALYHDQGLIPMKLIAFDEAVNTSLGLPFIRTSPDHGTAFDIANQGCAIPNSMIAAIRTAWELSQK